MSIVKLFFLSIILFFVSCAGIEVMSNSHTVQVIKSEPSSATCPIKKEISLSYVKCKTHTKTERETLLEDYAEKHGFTHILLIKPSEDLCENEKAYAYKCSKIEEITIDVLEKNCNELNIANDCFDLAVNYEYKNEDTKKTYLAYKRACDLGEVNTCLSLEEIKKRLDYKSLSQIERAEREAKEKERLATEEKKKKEAEQRELELFNAAVLKCESGNVAFCWEQYTKLVFINSEKAMVFCERACLLGHEKACMVSTYTREKTMAVNKIENDKEQVRIAKEMMIEQKNENLRRAMEEIYNRQEENNRRLYESMMNAGKSIEKAFQPRPENKRVCTTENVLGKSQTVCKDSPF